MDTVKGISEGARILYQNAPLDNVSKFAKLGGYVAPVSMLNDVASIVEIELETDPKFTDAVKDAKVAAKLLSISSAAVGAIALAVATANPVSLGVLLTVSTGLALYSIVVEERSNAPEWLTSIARSTREIIGDAWEYSNSKLSQGWTAVSGVLDEIRNDLDKPGATTLG